MPAISLQPLDEIPVWTIENDDVSIAIEQRTGFMRTMLFKERDVDLYAQLQKKLPGYIGGLRVYDERDEKWYSDLNDPFTVSNAVKRGNRVSFDKQFDGAPFKLSITLNLEPDALHWEVVAAKNDAGVSDRSLRVYFFVPLVAGWDVWAPAWDAEFTFDAMTSFEYAHIQVSYVSNKESILPMISHYSKALDVGFSMLEPIDARVPASKFQFTNGERLFNWGSMKKDIRTLPVLEAVNYYIGLVGGKPMRTKVMLMFHSGDWRPGLGKVFKRWKEYFVPSSETIYDYEGVFACEGVETADDLKRCRDFGIKTLEIHGHFNYYGDYYQDGKDSWHTLDALERFYRRSNGRMTPEEIVEFMATHSDEEIAREIDMPLRHVRHTRRDVKARLEKLSRAGVGCYWYFNYTDGFRPYVEAHFKDSIAKNEDGSWQPSGCRMCHNMNADPRWPFGRFALESAKKILKTYPSLNGFFLDCFRHFEIDFAHDDGVTVVNHKPAYSMNFSYDDIERAIRTTLTKNKLSTFANKPQSIRSLRHVDGVLLEGGGDIHEEKYFWGCIARPLFFMWTSNEHSVEENLRRAVYHGSFPKYAADKKLTYARNKKLFDCYLPLCAQFKRRVFCFEPDPLRAPHGSSAKLYTIGNDYIASVFSKFGRRGDKLKYARTPHLVFRVARGHDVAKAGIMTPGDRKFRRVKFKFDGTFIYVPLEGYSNCAIVRLFVSKKTGKKIGDGRFQKFVDYCGDPESAYSARNEQ